EDGEDQDAARWLTVARLGCGGEPVLALHLAVEQRNVGIGLDSRLDHAVTAVDLGDDLNVVLDREQRGKRAADHGLVLGDKDLDQAGWGTETNRWRPEPLTDPTRIVPPTSSTRSRMPARPLPPLNEAAPRPSSTTSRLADPFTRVSRTSHFFAPLCLTTLVTASRRHHARTLSCSGASRPTLSSTSRPMPAAISA